MTLVADTHIQMALNFRIGVGLLALAGFAQPLLSSSTEQSCTPSDGLHYICGPNASEDIARVPGTSWMVASGLNTGEAAHLYLVDAEAKQAKVLFPIGPPAERADRTLTPDCPGPPDPARMSTDGVNIRNGGRGNHLLYVANHGDRNAIEIFRIEIHGASPELEWVGCAIMPDGTLPNAVVPIAGGRLLVTSFYDPRNEDSWKQMELGEPTGSLWEWAPGSNFRRVDIGPVSGANGLETSADGRMIYVSAWSAGQLVIYDRRNGKRRALQLGFLPDNIKRAPDGSLLIAGQRTSVASVAACRGPACPQDWTVARFDPSRATVTTLLERSGNGVIDYACTALQVADTLYITARGDRRLAYIRVADLPSPTLRRPRSG